MPHFLGRGNHFVFIPFSPCPKLPLTLNKSYFNLWQQIWEPLHFSAFNFNGVSCLLKGQISVHLSDAGFPKTISSILH